MNWISQGIIWGASPASASSTDRKPQKTYFNIACLGSGISTWDLQKARKECDPFDQYIIWRLKYFMFVKFVLKPDSNFLIFAFYITQVMARPASRIAYATLKMIFWAEPIFLYLCAGDMAWFDPRAFFPVPEYRCRRWRPPQCNNPTNNENGTSSSSILSIMPYSLCPRPTDSTMRMILI